MLGSVSRAPTEERLITRPMVVDPVVECLGEEESAAQVVRDHPVEDCLIDIDNRAVIAAADVVDQNVEPLATGAPLEFGAGGIGEFARLGLAAQFGLDDEGLPARRPLFAQPFASAAALSDA